MKKIILLLVLLVFVSGCINQESSTDFIPLEDEEIAITEIEGQQIQQDDEGFFFEIEESEIMCSWDVENNPKHYKIKLFDGLEEAKSFCKINNYNCSCEEYGG